MRTSRHLNESVITKNLTTSDSRRQGSIDALGVLSKFYGKDGTKGKGISKKDGIDMIAGSRLVGRSFQYVTQKGECKNYAIESYLPWNGFHRVRKLNKNGERVTNKCGEYKTKVIDLNEYPNIRWLDENRSGFYDGFCGGNNLPSMSQTSVSAATEVSDDRFTKIPEDRKRKRNAVSPVSLKKNNDDDYFATPPPPKLARNISNDVNSCSSSIFCSCESVEPNEEECTPPPKPGKDADTKISKICNYNGVTYIPRINRYQVQCRRKLFVEGNKKAFIGTFKDEIEAAKAYDAAVRKHMPSAKIPNMLNFPTPSEIAMMKRVGKENPVSKPVIRSPIPDKAVSTTTLLEEEPSRKKMRRDGLFAGDRIAFALRGKDNIHFGTVAECGSENDQRNWMVSFDIGEMYELDDEDIDDGLELYDEILEREELFPLPKWGSLQVGDRTAVSIGWSGVHFGRIKEFMVDDKSKMKWKVAFDDGDIIEFDSSQIKKGIDLYRRIREKKDARSLVSEVDEPASKPDSDGSVEEQEPAVSIRKLRGMKVGDRIAYEFGTAGVFFGSIEGLNVIRHMPRKNMRWDIEFDDGDRYKFDAFEMATGIALYEKIRLGEKNNPECVEKIRMWRETHLAEKRNIKKKIPKCIQKMYREVGFAKWGQWYLPVMFLGPYDVGPGSVREQWKEAFAKEDWTQTPVGKIPQIVYWFGESTNKGFSILEEKECLSLEEGKKKGLLRRKENKSKSASKHNHAISLLWDAHRKPSEARLPLGIIKEHHERVSGPDADRLLAELNL
jgi:hypothetical protein